MMGEEDIDPVALERANEQFRDVAKRMGFRDPPKRVQRDRANWGLYEKTMTSLVVMLMDRFGMSNGEAHGWARHLCLRGFNGVRRTKSVKRNEMPR